MPTRFEDLIPAPTGRFDGIVRPYTPEDVERLRGSLPIEHTLARRGALKLWQLLHQEEFINALGALSGNQAMQMVRAGLKAIYLSGWQVAADANTASARCIPTSRSTPPMPAPSLPSASTARSSAPTRSRHIGGGPAVETGSRRSSPMPKPVSAAR
jgi:isocitrate lyase